MIDTLFTSINNFFIYFALAIALIVAFKFIYVRITPYNEWSLIKDEKNTAAAIGFGGAVIGYATALSGALSNSVSLIDFAVWGVIALISQVVAFGLALLFMPKMGDRIKDGELSAGIMLAVTSLAVGLINSACMTY